MLCLCQEKGAAIFIPALKKIGSSNEAIRERIDGLIYCEKTKINNQLEEFVIGG